MSRTIKGNKQAVKQLYSDIKRQRYVTTTKHLNTLKQAKTTIIEGE